MLVTIICWANLFYHFISELKNVKKTSNSKKPVEKIDIIKKEKVITYSQKVRLRPGNCYMLPKKVSNNSLIHDVNENEKIEKEVIRISKQNKWWKMRYHLFSKFDDGIIIDSLESWYSITPEKISISIAQKIQRNIPGKSCTILDGFCGVGGNTIQLAKLFSKVFAIDINAKRIEAAKHNAKLYGVEDKIEFIIGDFFQVAPRIKADVVFLAPPWGGPGYKKSQYFDLETMIPMNGIKIFQVASKITKNIAYYVPKNTNMSQLSSLAGDDGKVEICKISDFGEEIPISQKRYADKRYVKVITAYYGDLSDSSSYIE